MARRGCVCASRLAGCLFFAWRTRGQGPSRCLHRGTWASVAHAPAQGVHTAFVEIIERGERRTISLLCQPDHFRLQHFGSGCVRMRSAVTILQRLRMPLACRLRCHPGNVGSAHSILDLTGLASLLLAAENFLRSRTVVKRYSHRLINVAHYRRQA